MTHDPLCDPSSQGLGYIKHRKDGSAETGYIACDCETIDKVRADERARITFETWVTTGVEKGWVAEPVCSTHNVMPYNAQEEADWDEGLDPCMPVLRIWTDAVSAS